MLSLLAKRSLVSASRAAQVVYPSFARLFSSSDESEYFSGSEEEDDEFAPMYDNTSKAIKFNFEDCIQCGACIEACEGQADILEFGENEDGDEIPVVKIRKPLDQSECISCGQCAVACPVYCITEVKALDRVMEALDNGKTLVVETAPSIRVSIAEEFGEKPGAICTEQMVGALKACGFQYVFDTNFGADITIVEEANEFVDRLKNGGVLPQFTSCCPGWVNLAEKRFPELIPHLSTAGSPLMMIAPAIKTYWAEKQGVKADDIFHVAIMPCTAKKDEIVRPQHHLDDGTPLCDEVLTTREFAELMKMRNVDWNSVENTDFDSILGECTGAAAIFGATGGVMEAALRTAADVYLGADLDTIEYEDVRGMDGFRQVEVQLGDDKVKVGVIHGASNADAVVRKVLAGDEGFDDFHFIEVMACRGGCVGGGGQPKKTSEDIINQRRQALYEIDSGKPLRKSHDNVELKQFYSEYIGEPLGEKAHHLLHAGFTDRSLPVEDEE